MVSGKRTEILNMQQALGQWPLQEVILMAEKMLRESETVVNVVQNVRAWPLDAALLFDQVCKDMFGWTETRAGVQRSMFGEMKVPPTEVDVEVDYGVFQKASWGGIGLPGVEGELQCKSAMLEGMPCFQVAGSVKKRSLPVVNQVMDELRRRMLTESIYRGKALIIEPTKDPDTGEDTVLLQPPKFFMSNGLTKEDLVFPKHIRRAVNAEVFGAIEHADRLKARGLSTKRTIVLDGRPGTGKTSVMVVSSKLCKVHGRTFILVKDIDFLEDVIRIAHTYNLGRTLISAEDIDRRMFERDDAANKLLNAIDGVDSKNLDIMFLFTTNCKDRLIETFQRAGRSDCIITLPVPDQECATQLLQRVAGPEFELTNKEFAEIGKLLAEAETLPSNVVEVVNKSIRYQVAEGLRAIDFELVKDAALKVIEEKCAKPRTENKPYGLLEQMAERVSKVAERIQ